MPVQKNHSHENYERVQKTRYGSEKMFGITLGVVFLLIAVAPLLLKHQVRPWALALSLIFFITAFTKPTVLKTVNIFWIKLGLWLNALIAPVVLAILFFLVFMPMGQLLKLLKKDILNLKIEKTSDTYWIKSESTMSSMKDQF